MAPWNHDIFDRLMLSAILSWSILLGCVYLIGHSIYAIYFHPLSRYPGPKIAAISPIALLVWEIRGKVHSKVKHLHDRYGDVVRIGPNALVYRAPRAWKEIYGYRTKKGQRTFQKDPSLYVPTPNGVHAIITAAESDHIRMRRLLAHAFSDRALREQESLLHFYADLLVQKLHENLNHSHSEVVDIARWYNFTTFDLIGDLAFGEPFQCLKDSPLVLPHPEPLDETAGSTLPAPATRGKFPVDRGESQPSVAQTDKPPRFYLVYSQA